MNIPADSNTAFNSSPRRTPDPNAWVNCNDADAISCWLAPAITNNLLKFSANAIVSLLDLKASPAL